MIQKNVLEGGLCLPSLLIRDFPELIFLAHSKHLCLSVATSKAFDLGYVRRLVDFFGLIVFCVKENEQ